MPPAISRTGAEDSTAWITLGSPLKVAVKEPIGPSVGETIQTINQGNIPRTTKTATSNPQVKNHFFAFSPIVERTWALIMALSREEIVSKRTSPNRVKTIDKLFIHPLY